MKNYTRSFLLLFNVTFGQSIPGDYGTNQSLNFLFDNGYSWDVNTIFKPILWQDIEKINISINNKYL